MLLDVGEPTQLMPSHFKRVSIFGEHSTFHHNLSQDPCLSKMVFTDRYDNFEI